MTTGLNLARAPTDAGVSGAEVVEQDRKAADCLEVVRVVDIVNLKPRIGCVSKDVDDRR